jgi:hemerythrin-like domain-containing protein
MNPIEKLKDEHKIILRGIELLERGATHLEQGENLSADFFRKLIDFIQNYADKYHHAKEEDILFVRLGEIKFSPEMGPVAVMLNEHKQGRNYIANLEQANERYAAGDASSIKEIIKNARGYAGLLRQHILKEDLVLYPMAQNALGDKGIDQMQPDFARVEQMQNGVEQKYLDILRKLETI